MDKKKAVLYGLLFAAVVVVLWNLFEFLWCTFLTHEPYRFQPLRSLAVPAVSALIVHFGLLFIHRRGRG